MTEAPDYLPIDLDWLDRFIAETDVVLGTPTAIVVRTSAEYPGGVRTRGAARDYLKELARLARIGQQIEDATREAALEGAGIRVTGVALK